MGARTERIGAHGKAGSGSDGRAAQLRERAGGAGDVELAGAVSELDRLLPRRPDVFIVLGSGLGGLADAVEDAVTLPFSAIRGLPEPGVAGHEGRFTGGMLEGRPVLVQAGRFHLYEGHPAAVVLAPVRIAARLGIPTVLLTNASGGIRHDLGAGSILLVDDHLNLTWQCVLAGPVEAGEERFPDMCRPYDPDLQARALEAAGKARIPLTRGTYAGVLGPSYETPAEVSMLRRLGADAVGMSTVPEVLAARALGLRVLALSLVTNRAASREGRPLSHEEVLDGARAGAERMEALVRALLRGPLP